jgi:hypothetical protein
MPQPIFLELDPERRTVRISWNAEIGNAVPVGVYNCLVRRYTIPLMSRCHAARLARTLRPLLERVCVGWSETWYGGNYIGSLNFDAVAAEVGIERHIANLIPGSF